ncbi:hypothetical protein ACHMW6_33445 [Pseudoduganella sp. UC29_106]|uniref:hypothetical protein n=1 Tax=Pseudoduganella sp. UC29_106 TaxID=3374553 RepID=UPI003756B5AF
MIDTEDILKSLEPQPLLPPPPRTVRDTGLELQMLAELVAKSLYITGKTHLPILTTRLRLSINVLREVMDFLSAEQLAEVAWRGDTDIDVQYQLTGPGRERAAAWLERRPYVGPAPVPLDDYRALVRRQADALPDVNADDVHHVFADDCLDPAHPRTGRRRDVLGAFAAAVRRAGQRQEHAGAQAGPPAARHGGRALCGVRGTGNRPGLRPSHPPAAARRARPRRATSQQRSALGAVPASRGAPRCGAERRHAGAALRCPQRLLSRAAPF